MIHDKFNARLALRMKLLQETVKTHLAVQPFIAHIESIATAVGAKIQLTYDDTVCLSIETNNLKGVAQRLLEDLERAIGHTFDSSIDYVSEWGASRDFFMKGFPLKVEVKLPMQAADGCRRVQVGTKQVPVYELRCDDDQA